MSTLDSAPPVARNGVFHAAFAVMSIFAVLPLCIGEYMPLIDIPQHAAQLAIGEHWDDPAYGYTGYFEVNWLTNQLLAYSLTRAFGLVLPLVWAIKAVLCVAVLGLSLAVLQLVRALRGDPFWALLIFPVGYSFSMYWGFFNFVTSLPIGIALIAASTRYALAPSRRRAVGLLLLAHLLFFSHVLILAYAGLVSAALIVTRAAGVRAKLLGAGALACVLPTVALWWTVIQGSVPSTVETPVAMAWGWHRAAEFLSFQVGNEPHAPRNVLIGGLLLALPFVMGARPTREAWRYLPLGITILVFALVPLAAIEVDLIYGRFAVFALPTLLFALEPPPRPASARRTVALALVASELLLVTSTFARFDAEAAPLNAVLQAAEPHKHVLYLPTAPDSKLGLSVPYSHFGCWYQVKRGGTVDFSFSEFFPMWYRYRAELVPPLPEEFDSNPEDFRFTTHQGKRYDYLLVRGPVLPVWFADASERFFTVAKKAEWTLLGWSSR